ncbi:MAG TPA: twin-arginine translocase subunit TatC [Thermoleophilia bacterium]|nr:twin-arginine translocase subunit TatC [Thermoleophilia bacterium]HQJ98640.1 twin-arginine translocase subunit TatC [Thermoleophilia bacterium]
MPVGAEEQLTLVEHLDELRKRIFAALIALAVGGVAAFLLNDQLFYLLLRPLPTEFQKITTFSPGEPFIVSFKIWVTTAIIMVSPYLIYQFWAFVGPAFNAGEKRYFVPVVITCSVLFLGGIVFAYLLVLPRGLDFLLNFNGEYFNVQNRATDYFTFAILFLLAFGVTFELPVVLVLLAKVGVIDDRFLRKNRRYAVLVAAVLAAFLTPSQDAFSMMAMFAPLVIMYEISVILAKFVQPKGDTAGGAEQVRQPPDDMSRAPA